MPNTGYEIFKPLYEHKGFSPELNRRMYPLDKFFNMSYTDVIGDKVIFDYMPVLPVGDGTTPVDACGGRTRQCVGSNSITLEINRRWSDLFILSACPIARFATMTKDNLNSIVNRWTLKQQQVYVLKEVEEGVKVIQSKTTKKDATGVNVVEAVNKVLLQMNNDNPLISTQDYTLLISTTKSYELGDLKNQCCDFLTNKVSATATPPFDVGEVVVVPDYFLKVGATQHDYMLYIRHFAPYWSNCPIDRVDPQTNEWIGYLGYTVDRGWGINYENFDKDYVKTLGFYGTVKAVVPTP